MSHYETEFENFLALAKHLLSLAEHLNEKNRAEQIGYIDLELIYNNLFNEFMKKEQQGK